MNIAGSIRKLVADNATAYALLGDRVFPIVALQDAGYPLVVVRRFRQERSPTHGEKSKVHLVTLDIYSFDPSAKTAAQVDEAVEAAIDQYQGDVTFMGETVRMEHVQIQDTKDDYDPTTNVCVVISRYGIRVKEIL